MALTMMSVGAAAVISMQKTSMQSNLDARRGDVAYSLLQLWVERLRKDAMTWTLPSPTNPSQSNFSSTQFLKSVPSGWFAPTALAAASPPISPGFDILGRDLPQASLANAQFCVHIRLTYLVNNTTIGKGGIANSQDNLIRADLRILWPRSLSDPSAPVASDGVCGTVATADIPDPSVYQSIYVTTSIGQNTTQ